MSLLSLSFLSSSQSFAPVDTKVNKIESKTLMSSGNDDNQKITEDIYDRRDRPDESLVQSITMQPVGHVSSVYRLCVGTPRQGLLAPNSRGRIDLYPDRIASDSVLSLDSFSHVWVMFIFHLNTTSQKHTLENGQVAKHPFPSKIRPPALGGKRVGIFATRSPHRPNQIGFSLCKIDKIVIPSKKNKKKNVQVPYHVYISGLDLVDGTPVLDIKPYVPHYDSVGHMYEEGLGADKEARLPKWVSDGLGKRKNVDFTPEAEEQLKNIVTGEDAKELEFYGKATGRDKSDEDALESIKRCIEEVLSVDVRSKWQTKKAREGKSRAETAKRVKDNSALDASSEQKLGSEDTVCTQQLDRLLIKFTVSEGYDANDQVAVDTTGSGADDGIKVVGVEYLDKKDMRSPK